MHSYEKLLSRYSLTSDLSLKNRIVMAPLIQRTACLNGIPDDRMLNFYALRTDAGLIITEATMINELARSYSNMPGIYTEHQIQQWRKIVTDIHSKESKVFVQLWHPGRISHRNLLNGKQPLAPSAIKAEGKIPWSDLEYDIPKEMNEFDIEDLLDSYVTAAENALSSQFDGIEIHAANGYLLEQFLRSETNKRQDKYGGSVFNKISFPLKVVDTLIQKVGPNKVGIRLSVDNSSTLSFNESDIQTYSTFIQELNNYPLAYMHLSCNNDFEINPILKCRPSYFIKSLTNHPLIACGSYEPKSAAIAIETSTCDLVSFGRLFLKNANFVSELKKNTLIT